MSHSDIHTAHQAGIELGRKQIMQLWKDSLEREKEKIPANPFDKSPSDYGRVAVIASLYTDYALVATLHPHEGDDLKWARLEQAVDNAVAAGYPGDDFYETDR